VLCCAVLTSCCHCCAAAEGYSWECQTQEGGWGLDAIVRENNWKLRGIVNGIDYQEWSPENDVHLTTDGYCQYDIDTIEEGKRQCKVSEENLRRSQGWSSVRRNGGICACLESGRRVEHPSSAQDGCCRERGSVAVFIGNEEEVGVCGCCALRQPGRLWCW
jgi:hypothetical protein